MGLALWAHALAFGTNVVIGVALVFAVYWLMVRRIAVGLAGGLVLAGLIVWTQATVGETLWTLTFEEKRNIIVVAGLGAGLSIVDPLATFKPELE